MKRFFFAALAAMLLVSAALAAGTTATAKPPPKKVLAKIACKSGQVPTPNPGKASNLLMGVDIAPNGDVWTVGGYSNERDTDDTDNPDYPLAIRQSPKGTELVFVPSHGVSSSLTDVRVFGKREIWIQGEYAEKLGEKTTDEWGNIVHTVPPIKYFVIRGDGSKKWKEVPVPKEVSSLRFLRTPSDSSRHFWMVGEMVEMAGEEEEHFLVFLEWNGNGWKKFSGPRAIDIWGEGYNSPSFYALPRASDIAVVPGKSGPEFLVAGYSFNGTGLGASEYPLFLSWDGVAPEWRAIPLPPELAEKGAGLERLAFSSGEIFVTGGYYKHHPSGGTSRLGTFVLRWTGNGLVFLSELSVRQAKAVSASKGDTWVLTVPTSDIVLRGNNETWEIVSMFKGSQMDPYYGYFNDLAYSTDKVWLGGATYIYSKGVKPGKSFLFRFCLS